MTQDKDAGRVAVVTGSGRGIGAAIAAELAGRGWRVVVNYREQADAAEAVVKGIEQSGGVAVAHRADVTAQEQAAGLVARAMTEFGRLDSLICNANVGLGAGDVFTVPWEVFTTKVTAELAAAFHPTQAALPELTKQPGATIIYLSSDAGRGPGAPMMLAQGVSKAALNAYARFVAKDSAPRGVRVNVLSPGLVRTEAIAELPPEQLEKFLARIPAGRAGEVQDVARTVALLAGPETDYLYGQIVSLNGGSDLGR